MFQKTKNYYFINLIIYGLKEYNLIDYLEGNYLLRNNSDISLEINFKSINEHFFSKHNIICTSTHILDILQGLEKLYNYSQTQIF